MTPLENPVKFLKGVGPKKAGFFSKLGINTIYDLLVYFPKEHDDRRVQKKIAELQDNEKASISGVVKLSDVVRLNPRLSVFKAAISDSTGMVYASFVRRT